MAQPPSAPASNSNLEKIIGPSSVLTPAVPVAVLIAALLSGSFLLLNYVHVLTGGTWTGIDLFNSGSKTPALRRL